MSENKKIGLISPAQFFPDQLAVYRIVNDTKINTGKPSLLHKHFKNPLSNAEQEQLMYEIADYLKNKENGAVYSFFKNILKEISFETSWHFVCCRLNKDKDDNPAEVVIFSYDIELLGNIKNRLQTVLEMEEFFNENFEKIALLTRREKEIIGFLVEGRSSKEIAVISFTSVHTVNTHRQHINKKLGLQNLTDLIKFADVFNLTFNKTNS